MSFVYNLVPKGSEGMKRCSGVNHGHAYIGVFNGIYMQKWLEAL